MTNKTLDPSTVNIVGGPIDKVLRVSTRLNPKRILKKCDIPIIKTKLIGGDSKDDNRQPPSIVLERIGDTITKISVKCTCGRHAELVCEEKEDDNADTNS